MSGRFDCIRDKAVTYSGYSSVHQRALKNAAPAPTFLHVFRLNSNFFQRPFYKLPNHLIHVLDFPRPLCLALHKTFIMASGVQDSSFLLLFRLEPMNEKRPSHKSNCRSEFEIGLDHSRRGRTTLATVGRDVNCDVVISDPVISRLQCSFEINPANGLISLIDRSRLGTTDVGGEKSIGFPRTAQRQVVVLPGFNDKLFLCGKQGYRFFIRWELKASEVIKCVKAYVNDVVPEPPHRALTLDLCGEYRTNRIGADDALTAVQSRAMSRLYTPGAEPQEMTWEAIETIKKKPVWNCLPRC